MDHVVRTEIINKLYNHYLNRDVDDDGIKAYYECTINEQGIHKIISSLLSSEEYKNKTWDKINNIYVTNENLTAINTDSSLIPLNIFTTWHTKKLPIKMKENVELMKQRNPEFKYYFYDDSDCREFIYKNFSKDVTEAFDYLVPGAYKADLWRYCILYIKGGIYLDVKFRCTSNFKLMELINNDFFVKDRPINSVYNGFMVTKPNNEILMDCINVIVENVKKRNYTNDSLSVSGPGLLGSFFNKSQLLDLKMKFFRDEKHNAEQIIYNGKVILENYSHYRKEQKLFQRNKHYHDLWVDKNIYYNIIIPKKIYQTWHTKNLPTKMKENVELLKKQNPEFEHLLFDDNDCRSFIQNNFPSNVLRAFDSLIPGAYKADLWRYCILYINGGIYLDIKFRCANDFKLIEITDKEYFTRDYLISDVFNALLVTLPKNEVFLKCINKIVENVEKKFYGNTPLEISGPALLGKFFCQSEKDTWLLFHMCEKKEPNERGEKFVYYKRKIILEVYEEYNEEQIKFQKHKHYGELWSENNIYTNTNTDTDTDTLCIEQNKTFDIQKTLHLKCKDKNDIYNELGIKYLIKFKELYKNFEIITYDNKDFYNIIEESYPDYLEKVKQIKSESVLSHIFSYLILYLHGGIYSDANCEPLKNISSLCANIYYHGDGDRDNNFFIYPKNIELVDKKWDFYHNPCNNNIHINIDSIETCKCLGHGFENPKIILGYEVNDNWHISSNFAFGNNTKLCNWFMISEPKQDLFLKMFMSCMEKIDLLTGIEESNIDYEDVVANVCGDVAFTKLVMDNLTDSICILPPDFFCSGLENNIVPETRNSYIKYHT